MRHKIAQLVGSPAIRAWYAKLPTGRNEQQAGLFSCDLLVRYGRSLCIHGTPAHRSSETTHGCVTNASWVDAPHTFLFELPRLWVPQCQACMHECRSVCCHYMRAWKGRRLACG